MAENVDGPATSTDDEVRALVPERPSWGIPAVVAACLLALMAAWFAPPWLNPRLGPWLGGTTLTLPGTPFMMTASSYRPEQRPVTVTAIDDLPGARVLGTWVSGANRPNTIDDGFWRAWYAAMRNLCDQTHTPQCTLPGTTPDEAGAWLLEALALAGAPLERTALPQRLDANDVLWVLWQVTRCDDPFGTGFDPTIGGEWPPLGIVWLRGPFGTVAHRDYMNQALITPFEWGREDLDENGICPA